MSEPTYTYEELQEDVVKWLRWMGGTAGSENFHKAADRIEALEAEVARQDKFGAVAMRQRREDANAIVDLENIVDRMKAENARLREALEPFAAVGIGILSHLPDHAPFPGMGGNCDDEVRVPTLGDFRRAASLNQKEGEG